MNMKKIYREIAKQHGVSVSEVRRDIQAAIDEAYKNPTLIAKGICREGRKPTPEEFIVNMVQRVKAGNSSGK